jgi:hypothetical protein
MGTACKHYNTWLRLVPIPIIAFLQAGTAQQHVSFGARFSHLGKFHLYR